MPHGLLAKPQYASGLLSPGSLLKAVPGPPCLAPCDGPGSCFPRPHRVGTWQTTSLLTVTSEAGGRGWPMTQAGAKPPPHPGQDRAAPARPGRAGRLSVQLRPPRQRLSPHGLSSLFPVVEGDVSLPAHPRADQGWWVPPPRHPPPPPVCSTSVRPPLTPSRCTSPRMGAAVHFPGQGWPQWP